MEKFFSSRKGVSFVTLVAMLISQFGYIGTNVTWAAAGTFIATETRANVPVGADLTQSATTATPTPNAGVKASGMSAGVDGSTVTATTFGVASNGINIIITDNDANDCLSATLGGSTPNYTVICDLNASFNVTFTPLTATGLTALIDGAADLTAIVKGTGGNTVVADTITLAGGIDAVAQVNTITIGGTIEVGDVFTATLPGAVVASFTAADTVADNVAIGLNAAIQSSTGYAGQDFTSGVSTNVVTLTAKVAGTGFTQTSGATNRAAVAQKITFTASAPSFADQDTFRAQINGTNYDYTVANGNTATDVVTAISGLINADVPMPATCTAPGTTVVCTADVAGTAFSSYSGGVADRTAPTVVSAKITGPQEVTVVFSEAVTSSLLDYISENFTPGGTSDMTGISGNATNTIVLTFSSPTVITSAIGSMKIQSTLTDLAGNAFAGGSQALADGQAPTVVLTSSLPSPVNGAFTVTAQFSETVTGFDSTDIVVVNGTKGTFTAVDGDTYTLVVTPLANGAVTTNIAGSVAIDTAGNNNTSATELSITADLTAPTAAITYSDVDGIVKAGDSLTITATFSEPLLDSPVVKIDLVGANTQTAVDMTKSDATHYTYIHTVGAGNGMTTVGLSIGTDTAGNVVTAAPTSGATFTVDNIAPTISETTPVPANINIATPSYTFTSDQAGTITYGGDCTSATTSASAGSNTINFAALGEGTHSGCTIKVTDTAMNDSNLLAVTPFIVDTLAPVFSDLTVASNNSNSAFAKVGDILFFTLSVNPADTWKTGNHVGFSIGASGGLLSPDFTPETTATGSHYKTYTILPGQNGAIVVDSLTFFDQANNTITGFAAPSPGITVDTIDPTITIGSNRTMTTSGTTANLTFTLSESSVNFGSGDVTVAGGTLSAFAGAGTSYTALFTPTPSSETNATIDVAGSTFTDAVGNNNTASGISIIVDTLAPTVSSITFSDTVLKIGDTATVTIVLSEKENIGTFTAADITTPNGVLSALSTADNITFTGTFTPNAATEVASNVAVVGTDWADYNGNLASLGISSANYIVDTIAPIVNISGPLAAQKKNGTAIIKFTNDSDSTPLVGECSIDNTVWVTCTTAETSLASVTGFAALPEGAFTLYLRDNDAAGNTGTDSEAGIIKDTVAPVTTLSGSATLTLAYGASYTELGATWADTVDGTGTIAAASSGSVNTSVAGTYALQYWKVDTAGNTSNIVTRTVTVSAPVSSGGGGGGSYTPPAPVSIGTGTTETGSITSTGTLNITPIMLTLSHLIFRDIRSNWARVYINALALRGIINNTEFFNPDNSLTRAEFLKIIGNAAGWNLQTTTQNSFRDISKTAWYSTYAEYALSHGIISPAHTFRPNDPISRAEVSKILAGALGIQTITATGIFSDVNKFSNLARYIEAMKMTHIFEGQMLDGKLIFRPSDNITRAEIAKVVALAFKL